MPEGTDAGFFIQENVMDMTRKKLIDMSDEEIRSLPIIAGGDETEEEKAAREAKEKADAEAAAEAAKQKDVEYWKAEAKKAFEDRDRAKNELREQQTRVQQSASAQPPEPDLNEAYWQKPAEVVRKIVAEMVDPFIEDRYELQKAKYATDPDFSKYAPQIDNMVKMQPELRKQPGIVDKLYRAARAMEFDPNAERERIRQQVLEEMKLKTGSSVEGAGTPPGTPPSTITGNELNDNERKVAQKFYPDLSQQEAFKKYAENKAKWMQGA